MMPTRLRETYQNAWLTLGLRGLPDPVVDFLMAARPLDGAAVVAFLTAARTIILCGLLMGTPTPPRRVRRPSHASHFPRLT
jgi:hypothetical protein